MQRSVLLLGNGLNNVGRRYEWKNLVQELISHIGAAGQIDIKDKPFPT